jgi:hypothetical protein
MTFFEIAKHFNPAWWFVMSCILILHYLRKI